MPMTAPLISLETFSASSALARAISSVTSSWILSRTSSTARPSSEMGGGSVDKALEHPREDERAGERGADQDLRTLAERRRLFAHRRRGRGVGRGGGGPRVSAE